jgi:uncharacterized RDD family membrane protein YckC
MQSREPTNVPVDPELATRWQRIGAVLIDALLYGVPAMLITKFLNLLVIPARGQQPSIETLASISFFCFVFFLALNYKPLKMRGQTIGKTVLGIKIIDDQNQVPNIYRLILLRQLPLFLLHPLPMLGKLYSLFDGMLIFGRPRKCIHDLLAGTRVVRVTP